jgi:GMP synthase (glutamine-hydrolysing)
VADSRGSPGIIEAWRDPWERPAILSEVLASHGLPVTTRSYLYGPDPLPLAEISGLAILGGPMGALDFGKHPRLRDEANLVRAVVDAGIPLLGICLGHQIIAAALGAALHTGAADEVGVGTVDVVADDPVFGAAGSVSPVFHWHHDVVELPSGATLLASTEQTPNQAFRLGDAVFSTQFHVEIDRHMLDRWLAVDQMADELSPEVRATIRADFDAAAPRMRATADRAFDEFADAILHRD